MKFWAIGSRLEGKKEELSRSGVDWISWFCSLGCFFLFWAYSIKGLFFFHIFSRLSNPRVHEDPVSMFLPFTMSFLGISLFKTV